MKSSNTEQLNNFTCLFKRERPLMNFRGILFIAIFKHIRKLYLTEIKKLTILP